MKIRIIASAAVICLTFGIAFAQQQQNRQLWKRTLSVSRNVNRSSLSSPLSPRALSRFKAAAHGQTILHQNTVPGLAVRRQAMAAKVADSLVPIAKPLPATVPVLSNVWVKVYGEANANKTNERLLDVQAHTEIVHFVDRTPAPQQHVEQSHELSLSGYGPPPEEETGATVVVDQQAGVGTEAQPVAPPEIENPYGGGALIETELEQSTAVTSTTGKIVAGPIIPGKPKTGIPAFTKGPEVIKASEAAMRPSKGTFGPGEGTTEGNSAPTEGTAEAREGTTARSEETTEGTAGTSEVTAGRHGGVEISSVTSAGSTLGGGEKTSTPGRAETTLETMVPSEAGTGSAIGLYTYGSSSSTAHAETEATAKIEAGPEAFGYGGGPEITEEHPSTGKSSLPLPSSTESQPTTKSEERPTVAIGTGLPRYGKPFTPAAEEETKGTERTPGGSEATQQSTEGFRTSPETAAESKLSTYGSSSSTAHAETEATAKIKAGPEAFGYGGGPEITEEHPSTGKSSLPLPSSTESQPTAKSEERPTVAIGTGLPRYGTPFTPAAEEETKGTERTPGGSEATQRSTEGFRTSPETAAESKLSTYGSSSSAAHAETEATAKIEAGPEAFGYGGGPEITEEHPSTGKSSLPLPSSTESQPTAKSEERPTVAIGTGLPRYGTPFTPAAEEETKGTERTPGGSEATQRSTEGFRTSPETAAESKLSTYGSSSSAAHAETEATAKIEAGPEAFGYGGGPEITEEHPSTGKSSLPLPSSTESQPTAKSEERPTVAIGTGLPRYGTPFTPAAEEETKGTERTPGGSEATQRSTEGFRTSPETAAESITSLGGTSPGREGITAESTSLISTEETIVTARGERPSTARATGLPKSTTGITELGVGLPGLSREPAKQMTKSIEEATGATPEAEGATTQVEIGATGSTATGTGRPEGTTGLATLSAGVSETTTPTRGAPTLLEGLPRSSATPASTKAVEGAAESLGTEGTEMTSYGTLGTTGLAEEIAGTSGTATTTSGIMKLAGRETESTAKESLESSAGTTSQREETTKASELGEEMGGGLAGYGEEILGGPESTERTSSISSLVTEAGFSSTRELPESSEGISMVSEFSEETTRPSVYSYETTIEESTEAGITRFGEQPSSTETPAAAEETTQHITTEGSTHYGGETPETPESSLGSMSAPSEGTARPGGETTYEKVTVPQETTTRAGVKLPGGFGAAETTEAISEGTPGIHEKTTKPGTETVTAGTVEIVATTVGTGKTEAPLPGETVSTSAREAKVSGAGTTAGKVIGVTETTAALHTEPANVPSGPEDFGYGEGKEIITEMHPGGIGTGGPAFPPGQKPTEAAELTPTVSGAAAAEVITIPTTGVPESGGRDTGRTEGAETSSKPTEAIPATEPTKGLTGTSERIVEYGTSKGIFERVESTLGTTSSSEGSTSLPEYSTELTEGTTVSKSTETPQETAGTAAAETSKETPVSEGSTGLTGFTTGAGTTSEAAKEKSAFPAARKGLTGAGAPGFTPSSLTETAKIPSGPEDFGYGGGKEEATQVRLPSGQPLIASTSTVIAETTSTAGLHPGAETTYESSLQTSATKAIVSEETERAATTSGIATYPASAEKSFTFEGTESSVQYSAETTLPQSSESYVTSTEGETSSYGTSEETVEAGATTESTETVVKSTELEKTLAPETRIPEETEATEGITSLEQGVTVESNLITTTKESEIQTSGRAAEGLSEETSSRKAIQSTESTAAVTTSIAESTEAAEVTERIPPKIPMASEEFGYGGGNEVTASVSTSVSNIELSSSSSATKPAEVPVNTEQNLVETSVIPESSSTSASARYTVTVKGPAAAEAGSTETTATEPTAHETVTTLGAETVPFTVTQELSTAFEEGTSTTAQATELEVVHAGENVPANIPTGPEDFGYGGGATEPSSAAAAALSSSLPTGGSSPYGHRMSFVSDTGTVTNELPKLRRPKKGKPYTLDCSVEVDEKGDLCREWAKAGLCEAHRPTMFLFCRRTCLCVGPPMDLRRRLLRL